MEGMITGERHKEPPGLRELAPRIGTIQIIVGRSIAPMEVQMDTARFQRVTDGERASQGGGAAIILSFVRS